MLIRRPRSLRAILTALLPPVEGGLGCSGGEDSAPGRRPGQAGGGEPEAGGTSQLPQPAASQRSGRAGGAPGGLEEDDLVQRRAVQTIGRGGEVPPGAPEGLRGDAGQAGGGARGEGRARPTAAAGEGGAPEGGAELEGRRGGRQDEEGAGGAGDAEALPAGARRDPRASERGKGENRLEIPGFFLCF